MSTAKPSQSSQPCPQDWRVRALWQGSLEDKDLAQVADHVVHCAPCQKTWNNCQSNLSSDWLLRELADCSQFSSLASSPPQPRAALGPSPEISVPQKLKDYLLEEAIGRGGMYGVYRAKHRKLDRTVAVKMMGPHDPSPSSIARFETELRTAGKVIHPNLVQATDAGEDSGLRFLVMEFVAGRDLSQIVDERDKLEVPTACEIARQAALGLSAAHQAGLAHGDVKPSNLMVSRTPLGTELIKVRNLGLAHLTHDHPGRDAATTAQPSNSLHEDSRPDQNSLPGAASPAADIFALGATLFHLIVGQPLSGDEQRTTPHLRETRDSASVPRLSDLNPKIPEELSDFVEQMLAPRPADRPSSAAAVAAALAPFCFEADLSSLLEDPELESSRRTYRPENISTRSSRKSSSRRRARRRRLSTRWVLAIVYICAAICGLLYFIQTNEGTLVIESADDTVQVIATRGTNEVELIDPRTADRLRLRPGLWTLQILDRPDLEIEPKQIALKRNAVVTATVRKPAPVEAASPATPSAPTLSVAPSVSMGRRITLDPLEAHRAVINPQGTLLAVSYSQWLKAPNPNIPGVIRVIDLPSGEEIATIKEHDCAVQDLKFFPDGERLLSCDHLHAVLVTEARQGKVIRRYNRESPRGIDISQDSKKLAITGTSLAILDAVSGETRWTVNNREQQFYAAAFDNEATRIATVGDDRVVRIWKIGQDSPLHVMREAQQFVRCVAWNPSSTLIAAGSYDGNARVYDAETGVLRHTLPHGGTVSGVVFLPGENQLLSASSDGLARLWNLETGKQIDFPGAAAEAITSVTLSVDGRKAAFAAANVGGWVGDIKTRLPVYPAQGHAEAITSVALSPDRRIAASGGADGFVYLWNAASGNLIRPLPHQGGGLVKLQFQNNGTQLVGLGRGGILTTWNVPGGEELHRTKISAGPDIPYLCQYSLASSRAFVAQDHTSAFIVNLENQSTERIFEGLSLAHSGVSISANGNLVACGTAGQTVAVWNVAEQRLQRKIKTKKEFSADADSPRIVFHESGQQISIFEHDGVATYRLDADESEPPTQTEMTAVHPIGRIAQAGKSIVVTSASHPYAFLCQETNSGLTFQPAMHLTGIDPHDEIHALDISPDGSTILVGTRLGRLHLYPTAAAAGE